MTTGSRLPEATAPGQPPALPPHRARRFRPAAAVLGALALLGAIALFAPEHLLIVTGAVGGLLWLVLSARRPLAAYLVMLFVFVVAYNRLSLQVAQVEGQGDRGNLSLGDVLWLGLAVGYGWAGWRNRRGRWGVPRPAWLLLPYLALASLLPVLGVMVRDWPWSYAVPGFRQVEWASFGVLAFALCRRHGPALVLRRMAAVLCGAGLVHLAYGLVQLGYSVGALGGIWILLDTLYAIQHGAAWFFYPRLTGLMVNPNSYGLWGAMLFTLAAALALEGRAARWPLLLALVVPALFALFLSSSRSALLSTACAMAVLGACALFSPRLAVRGVKIGTAFLLVLVVALPTLLPLAPEQVQNRLASFSEVYSEGADADVNAAGRVAAWHEVWDKYITEYPFGTWVPLGYATNLVADSFYLQSLAQGTVVFTLAWLGALYGAGMLGWRAYRMALHPWEAAAGLALAGWAGFMAGSNLTLSVMHNVPLVCLFWALAGTVASVHGERA